MWGYFKLSTEADHDLPRGLILPAADSFFSCVMFGILGIFQWANRWLLVLGEGLIVGC